jgi:hypothetical protein
VDDLIPLLRDTAAAMRQDFPGFLARWVEEMQPKPFSPVSPVELAKAHDRLFSHSINLRSPHDIDNDSIDADLAREYGNNHEPLDGNASK